MRVTLVEGAWALVYATPWLAALLVGGWVWRRIRPHSLFLAWAGATPIAVASLLVLSIVLVSALHAAFPPLR